MNSNVVDDDCVDNFLFRYVALMFGRRKQWKILLFVACLSCLFFSCTKIFAFSASDLNLLTDIATVKNPQVKELISNYCTQVLAFSGFVENQFTYNAKYSAFVYLLCSNLGSADWSKLSPEYFKRISFSELWFQDFVSVDSSQIDLCSTGSFQNDCDLSVNIPKLFNAIMNDYINMKQPNLYGMTTNFGNDETKMIEQINVFSSGYFDGIEVCGTNEIRYPTTCKTMKWYMKNVRTVLSDVRIFNASGVLAVIKKNVSCTTVTTTGDIFYCGLYGDRWPTLPSFVNLAYNELFYYRLFMWYYLSMLQKYPSLLRDNIYMSDYSTIFKGFSTQYMWSKDALSLSLRMMRDTYMAFPFHIGFSMYQEDLDGFWKALARLSPPIYTLYDKLRNVQKPQ